ncbi:MAG: hypothetical protein ACYDEE_00130 [Ignavibacteriaceae bacterium]
MNIKEIAIAKEERQIRTNFTEEELIEMKDRLFQAVLLRAAKQEAFIESKKEMSEELKDLITQENNLVEEISLGFREESKICFLVDNQESGNMEYYTEDGELVFTRKLRPDEKQTSLSFISKTS